LEFVYTMDINSKSFRFYSIFQTNLVRIETITPRIHVKYIPSICLISFVDIRMPFTSTTELKSPLVIRRHHRCYYAYSSWQCDESH